ncbi:acyl-CoA carboxylase epsilon subunit [Streptomyces sp. NPDC001492]
MSATPTVRLLRGSPDAAELAALLAALQAVAARRATALNHPPAPTRATWSRPTHHPAAPTWRTPGPRPRG